MEDFLIKYLDELLNGFSAVLQESLDESLKEAVNVFFKRFPRGIAEGIHEGNSNTCKIFLGEIFEEFEESFDENSGGIPEKKTMKNFRRNPWKIFWKQLQIF